MAAAGGLVAAVCLAIVLVGALAPKHGVPGQRFYEVRLEVPAVGNLRDRDDVRIAGTRVGEVVGRRGAGDRVEVQLRLDRDIAPLRSDTRVVLRAKGLLGQKFVELIPGTAGAPVPDGGLLREDDPEALLTDLPTALETFDPRTRERFADLLDGLGTGVLARGHALNGALARWPRDATELDRLARELVEAPGGSLRRLAPSLAAGLRPLAAARDDIARSFPPARRALQPFADEARAVGQMLRETPQALRAGRAGLRDSERLLVAARQLASAAEHTLPAAPSGLRSATRLLRAAPPALRPARALLADLRPASRTTRSLLNRLRPVLRPLDAALTVARRPIRVLGDYGCDLSGFALTWRSMLGFGRAGGGEIGPLTSIRLTAIGSTGSVTAPNGPLTKEATSVKDPYAAPCKEYGLPGTLDYEPSAARARRAGG